MDVLKHISILFTYLHFVHGAFLTTFDDILDAFVQGKAVRFYVDTLDCETEEGLPRQTDVQVTGGSIQTWEYFYSGRISPVPFVGASSFKIINVMNDGGRRKLLRLTQPRVYKDGQVRVRIIHGSLTESTIEAADVLWCPLSDGQSKGMRYMVDDNITPRQLNNFDEILTSLTGGSTVRFASHYYSCDPDPQESIGGGVIQDFDVYNTSVIEYNLGALIPNYFTNEGFLFNGASGNVFRDSERAIFNAWAIEFDRDWEEVFFDVYQCHINDGTFEGGIYYYAL